MVEEPDNWYLVLLNQHHLGLLFCEQKMQDTMDFGVVFLLSLICFCGRKDEVRVGDIGVVAAGIRSVT